MTDLKITLGLLVGATTVVGLVHAMPWWAAIPVLTIGGFVAMLLTLFFDPDEGWGDE